MVNGHYSCPTCARSYRNRCSYTRHVSQECGRPPAFACAKCGKFFRRRHTGLTHLLMIHNSSDHSCIVLAEPSERISWAIGRFSLDVAVSYKSQLGFQFFIVFFFFTFKSLVLKLVKSPEIIVYFLLIYCWYSHILINIVTLKCLLTTCQLYFFQTNPLTFFKPVAKQ